MNTMQGKNFGLLNERHCQALQRDRVWSVQLRLKQIYTRALRDEILKAMEGRKT